MITANEDIRSSMYRNRVTYWQLAHALGCSEGSLYRYMRFELPDEAKKEYLAKIEEIAKERNK